MTRGAVSYTHLDVYKRQLLTGDYLFVSKMSYGPREPQTTLYMPLAQHTLPFFNCKSYLEHPQWDYKRVKGLGDVQLNDIVVFNFPAGDTVATGAVSYTHLDVYKRQGDECVQGWHEPGRGCEGGC